MNKEDLKIGEFYVNINLYPHISAPKDNFKLFFI